MKSHLSVLLSGNFMKLLGTIDFVDQLGHDKFYKIVMDCSSDPARLVAVLGDYHHLQGTRKPFLSTSAIELHRIPREFGRIVTMAMERQLHELVADMEYFAENFMASDEDIEQQAVEAVEGRKAFSSTAEQRWARRFSSSMEVLAYPQYRNREVSLVDIEAMFAKLQPLHRPEPATQAEAA